LLGLLAGLLVVWGPATSANACSCAGMPTAQQFERADAVFIGRLLDRSVTHPDWPLMSSADPARHLFAVDAVLKGEAHQRQAVFSADSEASCGLSLTGEGPFAVFARWDGDRYHADLCNGTGKLTAGMETELAALAREAGNPDTPPLPGDSANAGWWTPRRIVLGSLLGLAVLPTVLLWRHASRRRCG
jgi:hypothetical protein